MVDDLIKQALDGVKNVDKYKEDMIKENLLHIYEFFNENFDLFIEEGHKKEVLSILDEFIDSLKELKLKGLMNDLKVIKKALKKDNDLYKELVEEFKKNLQKRIKQ